MSYLEIVKRALHGRSVNATAKAWGVPQKTLDTYAKGARMPDYRIAKIMAAEAGVSAAEMLDVLAEEESKIRGRLDKISKSFNSLVRGAKRYWAKVPATAY